MPSGAGCPSRPSRSFSLRHTIMITSAASSASPPRRPSPGAAWRAPRPKTAPRPGAAAGARAARGSATATAPRTPRPERPGRHVGARGATRRAATIPRVATARPRPPVVAGPPATSQRTARRRALGPGCLGRARASPPPQAISQAKVPRPPATAPRQAETRAARATAELPLTPPPPRPRPRPPRRRPTPRRRGLRRPPLSVQCPPMREAAPPAGSSACGTARDTRGIRGHGPDEWFRTRAGCNPCKRRGRMAGSADRRGPVCVDGGYDSAVCEKRREI